MKLLNLRVSSDISYFLISRYSKNVGSDLNILFTEGNKIPTGLNKRISTEKFRLKSLPFDITASLTFRA